MRETMILLLAMLLLLTACSQKESGPEFSRGTIDGLQYSSEFLGVQASFGEDWYIATEEELAQIQGQVVDSFSNEDYKKAMENGSTVYDLYAMDQTTGDTVNINFEKLSKLNGVLMTEENYIEANLKQLPDMLEDAGILIDKIDQTTLTFAGQSHNAIALSGTVSDIPLYETMVVIRQGDYISCITAASYYEDTTEEILALFAAFAAK